MTRRRRPTFARHAAVPRGRARGARGRRSSARNLGRATTTIREKRAAGRRRASTTGRSCGWPGAAIKDDVAGAPAGAARASSRRTSPRAGGVVHWARDAEEANAIVVGLVRDAGATEVVKVKSMATQEIELNEALAAGRDRRLGDRPGRAHRPARPRPAVAHPGARRSTATGPRSATSSPPRWRGSGRPAPAGLTDDPPALAEAARLHLREKFLRARVAISGANFAVAETGTRHGRRVRGQRPDVPDPARRR